MKRIRPSIWLTFIMVFWSVAMICQRFVENYSGLMATRVFLGVFEGGLFPGVNYYVTQWYPRHECGFRMALFFLAATLAGAFGGILARGISEMNGVGGIAAWAWIFILEGLLSIVVSFAAYWVINDYPSTVKFLTDDERTEIYIHMLICMAGFCPIYSFSLFLLTIIKLMGYTANEAQLMSVPPYVCACVFTIAASWFADRLKQRCVFILGFQVVAIAGFAMLAGTDKPRIQYAGTVLAAIGIYPQIPLGLAWNGNNIGGNIKRGTGIAMQVMGGNCGGIIASYVYITRDGPRFIKGHSLLIGIIGMARRDKVERENGAIYSEDEKREQMEFADNAPWFRYTV
ncbi:MFS general substrate transporter [Cadophora sp. DSE1049]|nr:MFS general substrate transporter [Cadophora sp. DSE1049]